MILQGGVGNYIYTEGKKYNYFAGNNYLGLANHVSVNEAVIKTIRDYGLNFAASRHTTGTGAIHIELEKSLSNFKNSEDSVTFASGYMGNNILLQLLLPDYSIILMDKFVHPSISGCIPHAVPFVKYYNHCDFGHLESLLERNRKHRPLVITDGVFAITGEISPLDKILPLVKKFNGKLIVDDAHATGILGLNGRGTPEHFNLEKNNTVFQSETMSKAIGAYGGFISGNIRLIDSIRKRSNVFKASTALPPPVTAGASASLNLIMANPEWRNILSNIAVRLKKEISVIGFLTLDDPTPIIPVMFKSSYMAKELSCFLKENGIIAPYMDYPVRQSFSIVRITVSITHTPEQVDLLLCLLKKWKAKYPKN